MNPALTFVIPAAGEGRRMGRDKLLLPLRGRPVLALTLLAVRRAAPAAPVVVAVRAGCEEAVRAQVLQPYGLTAGVTLVEGGAERQDSVARALEAVDPGAAWVVVHDGARPFAAPELFARVVAAAQEVGAAVVGVPVRDTLHAVGPDDRIRSTPSREGLWIAQTPQAFRAELLRDAHRWAKLQGHLFTDDASLVAAYGAPVRMVEGDPLNLKITFAADLELGEAVLMRQEAAPAASAMRVGFGLDVHPVAPDRPLVLGGVEIPCPFGLAGHSDADVLAHAVVDAVLGAAGLRDIGIHFPPGLPETRGAPSLGFVRQVAALLHERGWVVENVDATVAAEEPVLAPYARQMAANLEAALGTPAGSVNIKATTTEGLGFVGRGEGITAYAVALIRQRGAVGGENPENR